MIVPAERAYNVALAHADRLEAIRLYDSGKVWVELEDEVRPTDKEISELGKVKSVYVPQLPAELEKLNDTLVKKGWPDLSPWWRKQIARTYFSGRRNAVYRVGRRGGKSSSICRVAVYEALYAEHNVPPGDTGIFAIISAERYQAKDRLSTIKSILDALGIDCKQTAEEVRIPSTNRNIRCVTASLTAVVSFTCIGAVCDEEALWADDSGQNPAKEILASLRPAMATQKNARLWHISAPWSTLDVHHEQYSRGTDKTQVCFYAPTWVANPTVTEEDTHSLEPDEASWARAYKAVPLASDESKFFSAALIDKCRQSLPGATVRTVTGADLAFRRDSTAQVNLGDIGLDRYRVTYCQEWTPGEKPLVPSEVLEELLDTAQDDGSDLVCADLHYIETLREATDAAEIELVEFPQNADEIAKAYIRLRVLISQGRIDLSLAKPELIEQLKQTTAKPNQTGLAIRNPRVSGSHGDLVSALVCATYAIERERMPEESLTSHKRRMQRKRYGSEGQWRETPDHSSDS